MSQLTVHQIYSIEDKIKENSSNAQIAQYVCKNRSVISRLFKKYPKESFDAEFVITDRFSTKGRATNQHTRIEL